MRARLRPSATAGRRGSDAPDQAGGRQPGVSEPRAACSIVSNNYLAFARVWAESYRRFHPQDRIFVCVVDRPHPDVRYDLLPFEVVFAEDLGIPDFQSLAFRYDILELNTAVKPFLLAHLRDRFGLRRALYFDPDILVLDRLDALAEQLEHHAVLLTPHITAPQGAVEERLYLAVGVYNLGFVGLRLDADTERFLAWWQERLRRFCLRQTPDALFVDQGWMGLAPAFVDAVGILRDPIYNVAWWNLAQRRPQRVGDRWTLDGRPLGFFHFSGFDAADVAGISRHQRALTLERRPELRPLFEQYAALLQAAGHDHLQRLPYAFASFRGQPVRVPGLARRALQRVDPEARRFRDPFDATAPDSFFEWLREPLRSSGGTLNRLLLALWEERPELVQRFPQVRASDLPGFVAWARRHLSPEELPPVFLAGLPGDAGTAGLPTPTPLPRDCAARDGATQLLHGLDLRQPGPLAAWLNEPQPGTALAKPVLTRLALLVHAARPDVASAYPDPCGVDQKAYAYWFCRIAARELDMHPDLVAPVLRGLPLRTRIGRRVRQLRSRRAPEPESPIAPLDPAPTAAGVAAPGVNVAGYFGMDTGVGQVGRATLQALTHAGIAATPIPLDAPLAALRGRPDLLHGAPHDVTLLHANADMTPGVLARLPTAALSGGAVIGYWFWELAHFPVALCDSFRCLTEVWAPSRFCQAAFETVAPVPVRHVPPCVPEPTVTTGDRRALGLDAGRFYFLFCFDTRSVPERKNPAAVLEAFLRLADRRPRDVGLVLRVHHAESAGPLVAALRARAGRSPVIVHHQPLTAPQLEGLFAACDAFVSLHRCEGLGLLPIQALHLGKPVIATNYGGVTDFLDATTGFPVDYRLTPLSRDYGPYPRGAVWAEPDVEHAAEQMRRVLEDREETRRRAEAGRERVRALYGVAAAALRLQAELAGARARRQ